MTDAKDSLWVQNAQRWSFVKPPLRPGPEDVKHVEETFRDRLGTNPAAGVLLGVTPELAQANLPLTLLAIESEPAMIANVWPGDTPTRKALVGNWFDLAPHVGFANHWVMGDGSFNAIRFADYPKLANSVANVLLPRGLFSIRCFTRPHQPERISDIFKDPVNAPTFHILKWRVVMAVQGDDVNKGVVLDDVWQVFHNRFPDLDELVQMSGWSADEVDTINSYKGAKGTYTFPTLWEVMSVMETAGFALSEAFKGTYQFAERCPYMLFRRR